MVLALLSSPGSICPPICMHQNFPRTTATNASLHCSPATRAPQREWMSRDCILQSRPCGGCVSNCRRNAYMHEQHVSSLPGQGLEHFQPSPDALFDMHCSAFGHMCRVAFTFSPAFGLMASVVMSPYLSRPATAAQIYRHAAGGKTQRKQRASLITSVALLLSSVHIGAPLSPIA